MVSPENTVCGKGSVHHAGIWKNSSDKKKVEEEEEEEEEEEDKKI